MATVKARIREWSDTGVGSVVDCEVVKENSRTVWVRLPDGNKIKRHKMKHLVTEQS